MDILFNSVQSLNPPASVTESGMSIFVRPVQPLKASSSISFTEFGMTMLFKSSHPMKAFFPITSTVSGMTVAAQPAISLFFFRFNDEATSSERRQHRMFSCPRRLMMSAKLGSFASLRTPRVWSRPIAHRIL